jgi:hypothetical protein
VGDSLYTLRTKGVGCIEQLQGAQRFEVDHFSGGLIDARKKYVRMPLGNLVYYNTILEVKIRDPLRRQVWVDGFQLTSIARIE